MDDISIAEMHLRHQARAADAIFAHLENAVGALKAGDIHAFTQGFVVSHRAMEAAIAAGFDNEPLPLLFNRMTELLAYCANEIRVEIMRRLLDGKITGEEATTAWTQLHNGQWTEQAQQNADAFEALLNERQ
jgi:hypothetical protein